MEQTIVPNWNGTNVTKASKTVTRDGYILPLINVSSQTNDSSQDKPFQTLIRVWVNNIVVAQAGCTSSRFFSTDTDVSFVPVKAGDVVSVGCDNPDFCPNSYYNNVLIRFVGVS